MIIDFSVTNYRSIRDTMTLSFIAQKGTSDDAICPGYALEGRDFNVLPIAALYGANASGKSNVLQALDFCLELMTRGADNEKNLDLETVPFQLDEVSSNAPTHFEIRLALNNIIFTFRLSLLNGIILHEELDFSPPPTKRQSVRFLYSREWDKQTQKYHTKNGEYFSGPHVQLLSKIQKHVTYLSVLHQLEVAFIKPLSEWLQMRWDGMCWGEEMDEEQYLAAGWAFEFEDSRKTAVEFIRIFDTGLSDIEIEKRDGSSEDSPDYRIWANHETPTGKKRWEFKEESLGTKRLFSLMQPVLEALFWRTPLIIDEFGSNFHPKISREIISIFQNIEINRHGAQLIFTSHDNTLWQGGLLRRDEIWLTEKQEDGSTRLFPLSDYKVRNDLALDKAYLDGRFGAVPVIGQIEEVLKAAAEVNSHGTQLSKSETDVSSET